MRLNDDELHIILTFLRGQDLINTMCTCRFLYEMGLPILLGSPIQLERLGKIQQFTRFVLRDAAKHGSQLRDITLGTSRDFWDPRLSSIFEELQLHEVLDHAVNIRAIRFNERLDISTDPDPICSLVRKVFTLPTLKRLSIHFSIYGRDNASAIQSVASSLENARCSLTHLKLDDNNPRYPTGWFKAIQHLCPTLISLTVGVLPVETLTETFPRLTTLKIRTMRFPHFIPSSDIFRHFPRLRRLSIYEIDTNNSISSLRSVDHNDWQRRNTHDAKEKFIWPPLKHIKMKLNSLSSLGIECPKGVEVLDLSDSLNRLMGARDGILADPLASERQAILGCRPEALKLPCVLDADVCDLLSEILTALPLLTHVEYDMRLMPSEREPCLVLDLLDRLVAIHRKAHCEIVRINLTTYGPFHRRSPLYIFFDAEKFAQRFITTCPTLRRVFISWKPSIDPDSDINRVINVETYLKNAKSSSGTRYGRELEPKAYERLNVFEESSFM
ncbi:hypothetical protein K474DRAFT_1708669 [Panus rudis PR-1116 ss-1]|nr:hypothetical protein K474DRAFT_1708669 [Panus rudis PR-1116 ss-1]